MKAFQFFTASDSRHALVLLEQHAPWVKVLAGGTDLLVEMKSASAAPHAVIDISRAEDLKRIELTREGLRVGAAVTHADIMRSPEIREHVPVLATAAHTVGAVQTRNLGTLGGNLVSGVPSMDSGPALIALDAEATIANSRARRQVPLATFFTGPRKTALGADELLVDIVIPRKNLGKPAEFLKFGLRKGQALALVNVAASLRVDWEKRAFLDTRIALGAVAPTVMRATRAEACLEQRKITPEAMIEAGRIAADEAKPISDFRASADYRRELVAVLARRALENAYVQAALKRGERGR